MRKFVLMIPFFIGGIQASHSKENTLTVGFVAGNGFLERTRPLDPIPNKHLPKRTETFSGKDTSKLDLKIVKTDFMGVRANWESLQEAYSQEENRSGTAREIGFELPAKSRYWEFKDGGPGVLIIENKMAIANCGPSNVWKVMYNVEAGRGYQVAPAAPGCRDLVPEF